jgi:hypothetical protein
LIYGAKNSNRKKTRAKKNSIKVFDGLDRSDEHLPLR